MEHVDVTPDLMTRPLSSHVVRIFERTVRTAGIAVLVVTLMVLVGYAGHVAILTMLFPGLQAMSVSTATGLAALASAVLLERVKRPRWVSGLSVLALAVGSLILISHGLVGRDVISGPLAANLFGYASDQAGRTSPATAVGLILLASSLLIRGRPGLKGATAANICSALCGLLGGLALLGYAYGVRDLYALYPFSSIALHTAGSLFLLAVATLLMRPDRGWAAVIGSALIGGSVTRRQLTLTLAMPFVGYALLKATDTREVGPGMAMALLVVITMTTLMLLILRDGEIQDDLELERQSRAALLVEAKATLERDLQDRVAALEDATRDRIKAEDALRQAQKMEAIGQLTGGVAHDFNNLLTVIRSSVDLLKRPDLPEQRRARYLDAIARTTDRAAKLTGQLLAFARRQALKPEVFDVGQSVVAIVDMIGTLTGSRIRITTSVPDQPCFIDADPSQFDTALVNMAINARDAMNGEGELAIAVQPVAGLPATPVRPTVRTEFVAVSIADTGSGIDPAHLEQIFEPFFTTKGVGQGTGLGLSQVFGFAKQSGGEVTVTSEVGTGSVFTLYLPRVAGQIKPTSVDEPEALIDGHGTCVLVVEDNTEVGAFATQALAELGYRTVWAISADHALVELSEDALRFDVVFTDVVMPGMNGIDLAQEIRRTHPDLPVILTSGYSHVLAQNGTYGFELLHKPYSVDQLSRTLRKVAMWRRRKRMLIESANPGAVTPRDSAI